MPSDAPKDQADLAAHHTPEQIRRRLEAPQQHSYLSDFIYGGIDGAVTTFAIVSGVAGAGLSPVVVLILGLANLFGDGFSMAAANFLGIRADVQQLRRTRAEERREIDEHPEGEIAEVREIFRAKGLEGDALEAVVKAITSDHKRWVDTMITEEHGLALEQRSPFKAAAMTFAAFFLVGGIPLSPFVIGAFAEVPAMFAISSVLVAACLFAVGAMKSRFVEQKWSIGGLETLAVGGLAAILAYLVGFLLRGIVPGGV